MIKKVLICAVVLAAILLAEASLPLGVAAAASAVFAARAWLWPQVPVASYFTTRWVALPAAAAVAGIALEMVAQGVPAPVSALCFSIGFVEWLLLVWMFAGVMTPFDRPHRDPTPAAIIAMCTWIALGLATVPWRHAAAAAQVASQPIASPVQPLCYRHTLAYSLGYEDESGRICGTVAWPAVTTPPAKTPTSNSIKNSAGAQQ